MNAPDGHTAGRLKFAAMLASIVASVVSLAGCSSGPPIATVPSVDLERFMGDWYVIASIPTFLEKGAHNAVERYELEDRGRIQTTFTFRDGSHDGELKIYRPVGFVRDTRSNAEWGMQFVWPFEADYRIVYLAEDYSLTVIARNQRDYAWIMARDPVISDEAYSEAVALLATHGYDVSALEKVPQRWD
jgi:apolipoprotein D and lipocalin family protein